jgi:hypothetical protein
VLEAAGPAAELLVSSNKLLHDLILGITQHFRPGCLHMLRHQYRLQLLQALAAPLQQLLLEPDDTVGAYLLKDERQQQQQQQQPYALRVAASGFAVGNPDDPDIFSTGKSACTYSFAVSLHCDLVRLQRVCEALVWANGLRCSRLKNPTAHR